MELSEGQERRKKEFFVSSLMKIIRVNIYYFLYSQSLLPLLSFTHNPHHHCFHQRFQTIQHFSPAPVLTLTFICLLYLSLSASLYLCPSASLLCQKAVVTTHSELLFVQHYELCNLVSLAFLRGLRE